MKVEIIDRTCKVARLFAKAGSAPASAVHRGEIAALLDTTFPFLLWKGRWAVVHCRRADAVDMTGRLHAVYPLTIRKSAHYNLMGSNSFHTPS